MGLMEFDGVRSASLRGVGMSLMCSSRRLSAMRCGSFLRLSDCLESRSRLLGSPRRLPKSTSPQSQVRARQNAAGPRDTDALAADINSQDATYVLAYSVIMLNTDLHNPQVRKRMDIGAYSRNLRGVNDNADFSPEYLVSLSLMSSSTGVLTSGISGLYLRLDSEARDRAARVASKPGWIRVRLERTAASNAPGWFVAPFYATASR